jgi:hypothetical protein
MTRQRGAIPIDVSGSFLVTTGRGVSVFEAAGRQRFQAGAYPPPPITKKTSQNLGAKSLGVGSIPWPGGEMAGAAFSSSESEGSPPVALPWLGLISVESGHLLGRGR